MSRSPFDISTNIFDLFNNVTPFCGKIKPFLAPCSAMPDRQSYCKGGGNIV
jgi:hypothetical protein